MIKLKELKLHRENLTDMNAGDNNNDKNEKNI